MKVLQTIKDNEGFSVLIQDRKIKVWLDVWGENLDNFEVDWNMYIFHHWNKQEMIIKKYQENNNNFTKCSELAMEAVEIYLQNNPN